jgi:hypothetical protein
MLQPQRICSTSVLLEEAISQWTDSTELQHSLAEAYDDLTGIYLPQNWTQFCEGAVAHMTFYGLLHSPSAEPCSFVQPCPELATFCQEQGHHESIPFIGIFLKV